MNKHIVKHIAKINTAAADGTNRLIIRRLCPSDVYGGVRMGRRTRDTRQFPRSNDHANTDPAKTRAGNTGILC